jgi:G3E family GTPase
VIPAAATFRAPSRAAADRLPVTLVTGFLGSGKTTLINHILSNRQGVRAAVLVNEFGDIGIDNDLIIASADDMIELNNGCICCTTNNDLIDSIVRVLARADQLDHIIVETTGVADPLPVALTFLRSEFREALRLDAIVTVADAEHFSLDRFDTIAARHQLRHADAVLLNKCDIATAPGIADVESRIRAENPNARILLTTRAAVPLPLILDVDLFRERAADHHTHLHEDGFTSLSFASDRPFSVTRFQHFLDTGRPPGLFRGKGFLWLAETNKRYVFHLVGNRFSLDDDTRTDPGANRLVLIGRDLDEPDLRTRLASCLAAVS